MNDEVFRRAMIPAEMHCGLISPVTDGTLEKLAIERDWEGFGQYLWELETLPSLDDYVATWSVSASSLWLFWEGPKPLTIWTAWTTAHVLNHFNVIAHKYARRNEIWPREYTIARKCFLDIFVTLWEPELTPEEKLSVQEYMLKTWGDSMLLNWVPEHMIEVAQHLDIIMSKWSDNKSKTMRKAINKTTNRFSLLLKKQHAIRAISEFGQFST